MNDEELRKLRKHNRTKGIIGLLLVCAILYFVYTNYGTSIIPGAAHVVKGPEKTCTEIRGPETFKDTSVEQLKIADEGFEAIKDETRAVIRIVNKDDMPGDVRVRLYCDGGDEQGDETKMLRPGETGLFLFENVADCDLQYVVEPQTIKRTVERKAYADSIDCE